MNQKTLLIISVTINVLFLLVLLTYAFTPVLDYIVVSKSQPRMCKFIEKNEPDKYKDADICKINLNNQ